MLVLLDGKTIMGIGIGFVISALLVLAFQPAGLSKAKIEKAARDMGMVYKDEMKALYDK
jgi:Na+-transporting methylmalonyl-CoA/oxaloacetate decarboxylase gamma subunit